MVLLLEKEISDFIKLCNGFNEEYNAHIAIMKEQDALTQDLLHKLELEKLNAVQMMQVAKQLKEAREVRRYHKDLMEECEPLAQFLSDPNNKKLLKALERTLGDIRHVKESHKFRRYYPRVL